MLWMLKFTKLTLDIARFVTNNLILIMKISQNRAQNIERFIQYIIPVFDVVTKVTKDSWKDCHTRF